MSAPAPYEELVLLPNGQKLWYIDKHPTDPKQDHSYWRHNPDTGRKGTRLTGVTSAVKTLDYDPKNLLRWAARTQLLGVAQLYLAESSEFAAWLTSPDRMWKELEDHGLTYDQIRDKAGDEGTNVHVLAFQALAMGRPVPDFNRFNERELQRALAVSQFFLDHEPKAAQVEQVVYSEALRVAGRLDFRGRLLAECDRSSCACHSAKGPGVIDLKTGGFISCAAHAQVGGGYPLLAEESGFGESNWAAILQVFDDGTYEFFKAEGTPESFESALETYRFAGKINGAAAKARDGRKTAREMDAQLEAATEAVVG